MQKYIHLVQIVETEKVAANQLRTQLEDQDTEIERLKSEVQTPTSSSFHHIIPHLHAFYGQHLFLSTISHRRLKGMHEMTQTHPSLLCYVFSQRILSGHSLVGWSCSSTDVFLEPYNMYNAHASIGLKGILGPLICGCKQLYCEIKQDLSKFRICQQHKHKL